jgi:hypothetical protein
MPAKANELRARLHAWRKEVGAQMPSRNPDHDASKPNTIPLREKSQKPARNRAERTCRRAVDLAGREAA